MPATLAALTVLIFLLPGLLTDRIIASFTLQKPRSDLRIVFDAAVWAFVDQVLYHLLSSAAHLPPFPMNLVPDHPEKVLDGHTIAILTLAVISVAVGLLWSALVSHGIVYKVASWKFLLTRSTGRIDVWQDILTVYRGKWVRVHMKDGTKFTGWVGYFSDNPDKREIFLSDAYMESPITEVSVDDVAAESGSENASGDGSVDEQTDLAVATHTYTDLPGEGILLTDASEIVYVHVL